MADLVGLSFYLPFQTNFGENLYVVGNHPAFGAWDPRKGRRMTYRHPSSWFLHAELRVEADKPLLKYKYCIMNDNEPNGGVPRWEPGEVHLIEINQGSKLECKDVWGLGKKVRCISLPPNIPGKLYSSPLPFSGFDPFQTAYREIAQENIDVVVLLLYQSEVVQQTGGQDLLKRYGKDGYAVIWYPIDDFGVPLDISSFSVMLTHVYTLLKKGCNVAIQCHAGIGRTGLTLACIGKKFFGKDASEALSWVRDHIIGSLQSKEQVEYVLNFHSQANGTQQSTGL